MATARPVHALQIVIGDEAFALEFFWQQDRFAHRVVRQLETEREICLQSQEGTPQQIWPPSPPFQSISVETQDSRQVALLVGMAGKSHWSASVSPVPAPQAGWEFDVACLAKQPPQWLGSLYQFTDVPQSIVQLEPIENCLLEAGSTPQHLTLRCDFPSKETPRTLRWKYRISIADCASVCSAK